MGNVFISYSHKDEKWKNRIVKQLTTLEKGAIPKNDIDI
jgi:hypothetical protein